MQDIFITYSHNYFQAITQKENEPFELLLEDSWRNKNYTIKQIMLKSVIISQVNSMLQILTEKNNNTWKWPQDGTRYTPRVYLNKGKELSFIALFSNITSEYTKWTVRVNKLGVFNTLALFYLSLICILKMSFAHAHIFYTFHKNNHYRWFTKQSKENVLS